MLRSCRWIFKGFMGLSMIAVIPLAAQGQIVEETLSADAGVLDSEWLPDRIVMQTAGYLGGISLGAEYDVNHYYSFNMSYGITPQSWGGQEIQQINVKNKLNLFSSFRGMRRSFGGYLSAGLMYGLNRELFLLLPDRYPKGYYAPTALRYFLGGGLEWYLNHDVDLFVEYHYQDAELAGAIQSAYPGIEGDLGALGIGLSYSL